MAITLKELLELIEAQGGTEENYVAIRFWGTDERRNPVWITKDKDVILITIDKE